MDNQNTDNKIQQNEAQQPENATAQPTADTAFTAGCIQGLYRHDSRCGKNLPYASGST